MTVSTTNLFAGVQNTLAAATLAVGASGDVAAADYSFQADVSPQAQTLLFQGNGQTLAQYFTTVQVIVPLNQSQTAKNIISTPVDELMADTNFQADLQGLDIDGRSKIMSRVMRALDKEESDILSRSDRILRRLERSGDMQGLERSLNDIDNPQLRALLAEHAQNLSDAHAGGATSEQLQQLNDDFKTGIAQEVDRVQKDYRTLFPDIQADLDQTPARLSVQAPTPGTYA